MKCSNNKEKLETFINWRSQNSRNNLAHSSIVKIINTKVTVDR